MKIMAKKEKRSTFLFFRLIKFLLNYIEIIIDKEIDKIEIKREIDKARLEVKNHEKNEGDIIVISFQLLSCVYNKQKIPN